MSLVASRIHSEVFASILATLLASMCDSITSNSKKRILTSESSILVIITSIELAEVVYGVVDVKADVSVSRKPVGKANLDLTTLLISSIPYLTVG